MGGGKKIVPSTIQFLISDLLDRLCIAYARSPVDCAQLFLEIYRKTKSAVFVQPSVLYFFVDQHVVPSSQQLILKTHEKWFKQQYFLFSHAVIIISYERQFITNYTHVVTEIFSVHLRIICYSHSTF